MSRWMVNVRGQQFSAADMGELKKLAKNGTLGAGDIVQPPGAAEWIYAIEVPELKGTLRADGYAEFDAQGGGQAKEMNPILKWGLATLLLLVAVASWGYALSIAQDQPKPEDLELIGGSKGLAYTEVLVTADPATLYGADSASAQQVGQLPKNSKADLLAKRGEWYKLRANGVEGYAKIQDVIPAFFFADEPTQQQYKPLYYPDQYVQVENSAWTLTPESGKQLAKDVTSFTFMLGNTSSFPMTDIKLKVIIKDAAGKPLEEKEIGVEGTLDPNSSSFVGMLAADPKVDKTAPPRIMFDKQFQTELAADPKVADRWTDGVEVKLDTPGFTGAEVRLVEVRAVPPTQMPAPAAK